MNKESHITSWLEERFNPAGVVLTGSRAVGSADEGSDWDLYVYTEGDYKTNFYECSGETLDITFKKWPPDNNVVLENAYTPLVDVKVLIDKTDGVLQRILSRTREQYELGPQVIKKDAYEGKWIRLDRYQSKIEKFRDEPLTQFFYIGQAYALLLRLWFESQNLWPLPPGRAIACIERNDPSFHALLKALVAPEHQADAIHNAVLHVKKLKSIT